MQTTFAQTGKFAVAACCLLGATTVMAGSPGGVGSVSHSPLSSVSVPMLGGTGLVVLSALLAVVSLRFMKNRRLGGGHFLVLATLAGALATGGSGIKLISDAHAVLPSSVSLTSEGGGTVTIFNEGYSQVVNGTGVTQKLTSISTAPGCSIGPINNGGGNGGNGGNGGSFQGTCSDGSDGPATVLENLDTCEVLICCGINGGSNGGNGGCFTPI